MVKYYAHAHRQASISFMLSIAFAVIGFAIFAAAAVSYLRNPDQVGGAIIATVAGAVNEAIGFLFFQRADKARDLMVTMIDRLRTDREADRQFVSALGVIDQIENPAVQDSLRAAIATQYAGCSSTSLSDIAALAESKVFAQTAKDSPNIYINGPSASASNGAKAP
ncbi:TRADD-N-associated membrane domain-containing protein [Amycolatopsis minnesotensis]|uniref:Cyanobacterial TRADD-N associated 2 transmembrane domain-containing protein n=1 Tax=Amycolatopsis minnesotensis TaxID=337894 RepID=A0ABP5B910_9PSEU